MQSSEITCIRYKNIDPLVLTAPILQRCAKSTHGGGMLGYGRGRNEGPQFGESRGTEPRRAAADRRAGCNKAMLNEMIVGVEKKHIFIFV